MKLLLTSAGFTNKSISSAFFEMVGKKPSDITLTFIPTAANIETGSKEWFIDDLYRVKSLGLKAIHIVDISAVPEAIWKPQLEAADAIFFEGGDTRHLMSWITRSGLEKDLPRLLGNKVYVGLSAGSMVVCPEVLIMFEHQIYESYLDAQKDIEMLGFVDFYVLPHLNSQWFKKVTEDGVRLASKGLNKKIYALDDQSAVRVEDGKVSVISEGKYVELN